MMFSKIFFPLAKSTVRQKADQVGTNVLVFTIILRYLTVSFVSITASSL
jgi:hypothetical protein